MESDLGYVKFDPSVTSVDIICKEIEYLGFGATPSDGGYNNVNANMVKDEEPVVTRISVEGMTCHSCVKNIENTISQKPGVKHISVSLEKKEAIIEYNPNKTNPETLRDQIDDMGFEAQPNSDEDEFDLLAKRSCSNTAENSGMKTCTINIEGMTCQSCVKTIETNMKDVTGICEIRVSLENNNASVTYDASLLNPAKIAEIIDDMGFEASPVEGSAVYSESSMATVDITVKGMTCNSCVKTIEGTMSDFPGVRSIKVSLSAENAHVTYEPQKSTAVKIRDAIDDMGFEASLQGWSIFMLFYRIQSNIYNTAIIFKYSASHWVTCRLAYGPSQETHK